MRKFMSGIAVGVVIGGVLAGMAAWLAAPGLMLTVRPSRLAFAETVAAIQDAAATHGWKTPKVYDIQKSLIDAGHADAARVTVLSLCQTDHAYRVLREEANRKVSAVMPCRVGVYQGDDGRVYVAEINSALIGKMFGGTIATVMGEVAEEEHAMLKDALEK